MDKSIRGLVGAATLAAIGGVACAANASPGASEPRLPPAGSYAELLEPVPNATAILKAADASADNSDAQLQMAQYAHYHHHHHHWQWRGRRHHHHYHHYY